MTDIQKFIALATEELETAKILVDMERYRLCLSRSYYAMYYMSQALLLSEGFEASTHKGLIKLLGLHFVKTGKISNDLAKSLASAYDDRQMSDYNVRFEPTKEEALEAISEAQKFIKSIYPMLND
jgi:uncharacterized protein (UPF0332 family)